MVAALALVISYAAAGGCFLAYYLRTYHVPVRDVFLFTPQEMARLGATLSRVRQRLSH